MTTDSPVVSVEFRKIPYTNDSDCHLTIYTKHTDGSEFYWLTPCPNRRPRYVMHKWRRFGHSVGIRTSDIPDSEVPEEVWDFLLGSEVGQAWLKRNEEFMKGRRI